MMVSSLKVCILLIPFYIFAYKLNGHIDVKALPFWVTTLIYTSVGSISWYLILISISFAIRFNRSPSYKELFSSFFKKIDSIGPIIFTITLLKFTPTLTKSIMIKYGYKDVLMKFHIPFDILISILYSIFFIVGLVYCSTKFDDKNHESI